MMYTNHSALAILAELRFVRKCNREDEGRKKSKMVKNGNIAKKNENRIEGKRSTTHSVQSHLQFAAPLLTEQESFTVRGLL